MKKLTYKEESERLGRDLTMEEFIELNRVNCQLDREEELRIVIYYKEKSKKKKFKQK